MCVAVSVGGCISTSVSVSCRNVLFVSATSSNLSHGIGIMNVMLDASPLSLKPSECGRECALMRVLVRLLKGSMMGVHSLHV